MISTTYAVTVIAVCAVCTLLERALPFLLFRGREVPEIIVYLGSILPPAIMMTLVIYCMKDVSGMTFVQALPKLIAAIVTAGLHIWKRNTFLSIFGGTAVCVILTHLI